MANTLEGHFVPLENLNRLYFNLILKGSYGVFESNIKTNITDHQVDVLSYVCSSKTMHEGKACYSLDIEKCAEFLKCSKSSVSVAMFELVKNGFLIRVKNGLFELNIPIKPLTSKLYSVKLEFFRA